MTKPAFHRLAQLHPFNLLEALGRSIFQTAEHLESMIGTAFTDKKVETCAAGVAH
jgi:hypothetical protein